MKKMRVKATNGLNVPFERSRKKIGQEPVEVPVTAYYLRRVRSGELTVVKAEEVNVD